MKIKQSSALCVYGLLWAAAGCMLLSKGIRFMWEASAFSLAVLALAVGFFKAKFVLAKAAGKMMARLDAISGPIPLKQLFTLKYGLILGFMIALGISLRFFHLPTKVHGFIDLAIGSALLSGSFVYLKRLFVVGRAAPDLKSSVDLLEKNEPRELVGEGESGETN